MSRPIRLEFPGALYQITSRGDRREYYGTHTFQEIEISLSDAREIFDKFSSTFGEIGMSIAFFAISLISGNIFPSPTRSCRFTDD